MAILSPGLGLDRPHIHHKPVAERLRAVGTEARTSIADRFNTTRDRFASLFGGLRDSLQRLKRESLSVDLAAEQADADTLGTQLDKATDTVTSKFGKISFVEKFNFLPMLRLKMHDRGPVSGYFPPPLDDVWKGRLLHYDVLPQEIDARGSSFEKWLHASQRAMVKDTMTNLKGVNRRRTDLTDSARRALRLIEWSREHYRNLYDHHDSVLEGGIRRGYPNAAPTYD